VYRVLCCKNVQEGTLVYLTPRKSRIPPDLCKNTARVNLHARGLRACRLVQSDCGLRQSPLALALQRLRPAACEAARSRDPHVVAHERVRPIRPAEHLVDDGLREPQGSHVRRGRAADAVRRTHQPATSFFHLPVSREHRPYVALEWQGRLNRWAAMPFGLSIAPRSFSKTIKVVVRRLRAMSIRVVGYIDDLLIIGSTRQQCRLHMAVALRKLLWLGLTPSWDKCVLQLVQTMEFLGFALELVAMTVRPTARCGKGRHGGRGAAGAGAPVGVPDRQSGRDDGEHVPRPAAGVADDTQHQRGQGALGTGARLARPGLPAGGPGARGAALVAHEGHPPAGRVVRAR